MAIEFRIAPHSFLGAKQVVECWRDKVLIATIYPHDDGIRIVSKCLDEVYREAEEGGVPAAIVKLKK